MRRQGIAGIFTDLIDPLAKNYIMRLDIRIECFKKGLVHFIGCGGAGMVGLANIMHELGYNVSGSDIVKSENTSFLTSKGVKVVIGHAEENIPD